MNGITMVGGRRGQGAICFLVSRNAKFRAQLEVANAKIADLQEQLRTCIQALDRLKNNTAPAQPAETAMDVAEEISQNLESLVGTAEEAAPKAEPKHPVHETTTSRFANLNLQFGRNYDVEHK